MGAPVENETVFVRVDTGYVGGVEVCEARVLHRAVTHYDEFDFALIGGDIFGARRVADEGITWARPEHLDAFRTTVALSP